MNNDEAFKSIQRIVFENSGMRVGDNKMYLVETRLSGLCREMHAANIGEVMSKIGPFPKPEQIREIVEAMTTNETWWYRDMDIYNALSDVVFPELVKRKLQDGSSEITLWSAACSTGQEVYALKMVWEKFAPKAQGVGLKIIASDIDSKVLKQAQEGSYSQLEVGRGLPTMDLMMNFTQEGTRWKINDQLKSGIEWRQASLLDSPPMPGKIDITLCRNVLIYFDDDGKRAIIKNIRRAMRKEGILFVGGSESLFTLDTGLKRLNCGKVFSYGNDQAEALMLAAHA